MRPKNLSNQFNEEESKKLDTNFTLNPIFRCPTERVKKRNENLRAKTSSKNLQKTESKREDDEYDTLDLDKELLGTKSSKWKPDNLKPAIQVKNGDEMYLSPSANLKNPSLARLITGNTDNTKADSINKLSEYSIHRKSKVFGQGSELESFPSGNMFMTKSDDQDVASKPSEKIRSNKEIEDIATNSLNNKSMSGDNSVQ